MGYEEGEFHYRMMRQHNEWLRQDEENRRRDEENRRRIEEENRRRRNADGNNNYRNNYTQNRSYNYPSHSRPKDDGNIHYTYTMPSSRFNRSIITSIIGAVILGGVLGNIFGLFGFIGGAVGGLGFGSILGVIIGKKFFVVLVILSVLGGGLYMARSHIVPLFFSVTSKASKALPLSGNTTTITGNVNFRTEPSIDSTIIKTLQQDDIVISTGKVSDGWTQIRHNGDTGWVSSEYVKQ